MAEVRSELDQAYLFLQLVREKRDPRSVLREALSNSYDAGATRACIHIERTRERGINITIEDNGEGMNRERVRDFFGLALSSKRESDVRLIGEKGLGTKLLFDSELIEVRTRTRREAFTARMVDPIVRLARGELPSYEIRRDHHPLPHRGTKITAAGVRNSSAAALLDHESLRHYLAWFSVAGSAAMFFGIQSREFEVELVTSDAFGETLTSMIRGHELPTPPAAEDPKDPATFAYRFPPFRIALRDDAGHPRGTLEVVGAIVGARAHVVQDRTIKKHFKGFFLAKDHFPIRSVNQEVARGTGEWQSFHVVANCDELELSASREDFRDTGPGSVFAAATSALQRFFLEVVKGRGPFTYFGEAVEQNDQPAALGYAELKRLKAVQKASISSQRLSIEMFKAAGVQLRNGPSIIEPRNDLATALLFQQLALLSPDSVERVVGAVHQKPVVIALSDDARNTAKLAVIVNKLDSHMLQQARDIGADRIICWKDCRREKNASSLPIIELADLVV